MRIRARGPIESVFMALVNPLEAGTALRNASASSIPQSWLQSDVDREGADEKCNLKYPLSNAANKKCVSTT